MASGDFERSVIGYCALALPEDVLAVAAKLLPDKMEWNLHRALYKRCVRAAREGVSVLDRLGDVDPWMESDMVGVRPTQYMGHCIDVRCENLHQLEVCLREIEEDWHRRRIARAGKMLSELAASRQSIEVVKARAATIIKGIVDNGK